MLDPKVMLAKVLQLSFYSNKSSARLKKAGLKREGIVRKAVYIWGEWRDSYLYSILRKE